MSHGACQYTWVETYLVASDLHNSDLQGVLSSLVAIERLVRMTKEETVQLPVSPVDTFRGGRQRDRVGETAIDCISDCDISCDLLERSVNFNVGTYERTQD